jgi:hypothetical protein
VINTQEPDYALLTFFFDFFTKYFWMLTSVLGIPGNVLSLMISLTKDNRQFSTCIYMAALAVVDTFHLVDIVVAFIAMYWIGGINEFQVQ